MLFMQKAYDLRKAMYEKYPPVFEHLFALAAFNMGSLLQTPKTLTEALSYYDESLTILTRLFTDKPDMYRFDLVNVMINTGIACADLSKTQLALEYLEKVLSIIAGAPEEKRKLFVSYKALTLHHLGATYGIMDEFSKALSCYSQAHVIYQQLIKEEPIIHNKHLGMTAHNMAVLLIKNGHFKDGEVFCRQAITLKDELIKINQSANAQSMILTLQAYATLLKMQQRFDEQYKVLLNAVVLCRELIIIDHKAFADQFMNLLVELAIVADVLGKMETITDFLEIGTAMVYKHKDVNETCKYYFIILEKAWQAAGKGIHTVWEEVLLPRMNEPET
jgi:tetratricopeptide (TPR) repeat protein